jgi:RNA polymerase sigma-70 factor, ECF subfamily
MDPVAATGEVPARAPIGGGGSRAAAAEVWFDLVAHEREAIDPRAVAQTNSALVERLRRGDAAAIEMLYRQHHEAVRAFACRLVGHPEVAEDLVHEVFLGAPAAFQRYRGESTLRTFLVAVAVNKSKHHVRAASRRRRLHERLASEPVRDRSVPPDEAWERRELAEALQRALDQLPHDERVVVVLCEVEDRTSSEVAQIVDAPEATVRTRLFRAKRKLRAILDGAPSTEGTP